MSKYKSEKARRNFAVQQQARVQKAQARREQKASDRAARIKAELDAADQIPVAPRPLWEAH